MTPRAEWVDITDDEEIIDILLRLGHNRVCDTCNGRGYEPIPENVFWMGMRVCGIMPCRCCGDEMIPGCHPYACQN
jgi:hypothetical protein